MIHYCVVWIRASSTPDEIYMLISKILSGLDNFYQYYTILASRPFWDSSTSLEKFILERLKYADTAIISMICLIHNTVYNFSFYL